MGDPQRANRRLAGYGPMRLLCAVLGGPRMIFASLFSLLLPLMVVFFVVVFDCGFLSAPIGPCVGSVEGYISANSLAFRKAGCAAPFQLALPWMGFNSPARRDRARHSPPPSSSSCLPLPHHLEEGGGAADEVAPIDIGAGPIRPSESDPVRGRSK